MMWGGTVWAITLWTRNREPRLVGSSGPAIDPRTPRAMVIADWRDVGRDAPDLILGDFAVLPDRLRALLYLAAGGTEDTLASALGSFLTRSTARLGLRGASLWEPRMECAKIESPLELAVWQQRIRSTRDVAARPLSNAGVGKVGAGDGR